MPKNYAGRFGSPDRPKRKTVVGIDGGRAIEARRMRIEFDGACSDVALSVENMAGYIIIAWDDDGVPVSVLGLGVRNPYPPLFLGEKAKDIVNADARQAE